MFKGFCCPPVFFCGLGVSRWDRVKDLWNGYSGGVRFSESLCLFFTVGTSSMQIYLL